MPDELDLKKPNSVIDLIITLVIAAVIITVLGAVGIYIPGALNNTGGITVPSSVNLVKDVTNGFPAIGGLFVVLIIIAVIVLVIYLLLKINEVRSTQT